MVCLKGLWHGTRVTEVRECDITNKFANLEQLEDAMGAAGGPVSFEDLKRMYESMEGAELFCYGAGEDGFHNMGRLSDDAVANAVLCMCEDRPPRSTITLTTRARIRFEQRGDDDEVLRSATLRCDDAKRIRKELRDALKLLHTFFATVADLNAYERAYNPNRDEFGFKHINIVFAA